MSAPIWKGSAWWRQRGDQSLFAWAEKLVLHCQGGSVVDFDAFVSKHRRLPPNTIFLFNQEETTSFDNLIIAGDHTTANIDNVPGLMPRKFTLPLHGCHHLG